MLYLDNYELFLQTYLVCVLDYRFCIKNRKLFILSFLFNALSHVYW